MVATALEVYLPRLLRPLKLCLKCLPMLSSFCLQSSIKMGEDWKKSPATEMCMISKVVLVTVSDSSSIVV